MTTTNEPPKQKTIRLRDVAQAAGVSPSTVSLALSGGGRMTHETRERIRATARELNYLPNPLAKGLRTGRTYTIGLHHIDVVRAFANPYLSEFMAGVVANVHSEDLDVTLLSSRFDQPRRTTPRVDGVIIMDPLSNDERARELATMGVPVVSGEYLPEGFPRIPVVAVDHKSGVFKILDHCARSGYKVPLLIGPGANSGWGLKLHEAVAEWGNLQGTTPSYITTKFVGVSHETTYRKIRDAFAENTAIDTVIVSSIEALRAVERYQRECGRDLAITCASDIEGPGVERKYTYINLPARELGSACAELLRERIDASEEGGEGIVRTVKPTVIWHASTDFSIMAAKYF